MLESMIRGAHGPCVVFAFSLIAACSDVGIPIGDGAGGAGDTGGASGSGNEAGAVVGGNDSAGAATAGAPESGESGMGASSGDSSAEGGVGGEVGGAPSGGSSGLAGSGGLAGSAGLAGSGGEGTVRIVEVAAGNSNTCVVLSNHALRCWGDGQIGGNGYGNTVNIGDTETPFSAGDVPVGGPVTHVSMGGDTACALLATGSVRCWGANAYGELGYPGTLGSFIGDN